MADSYQVCTRCIMDTTDSEIEFDENGVCNHCRQYDRLVKTHVFMGEEGERKLAELVERIKKRGKNQQHDCIIGLSGGVDSTYVAYLVTKLGLRPLAVTLDNGWDSEIAKNNIKNIVRKLDLDLCSHVIDWEEIKDLQLAYLRASVVNIEVPTDHAIIAILYRLADQRGIKYILSGNNVATEGILPKGWVYSWNDLVNLRDIHGKHGSVKLRTFPTLGLRRLLYYEYMKNIRRISILDYVPYVKEEAKAIIARELDWQDYGAKHHESIFTRFYQAYILPRKFNIDKRKAHLSALVCAGQMTREDALNEIRNDPYTEDGLRMDKQYVLGRLGLTDKEFEEMMNLPARSHLDYKSDIIWVRLLRSMARYLSFAPRLLGRSPTV